MGLKRAIDDRPYNNTTPNGVKYISDRKYAPPPRGVAGGAVITLNLMKINPLDL